MENIARNFFSGPIGGTTSRAILSNIGINSTILGGYTFFKAFPLFSTASSLEYGLRKIGVPTTLYDIGERIGFTNFEARKKARRRPMVKRVKGLSRKRRYLK